MTPKHLGASRRKPVSTEKRLVTIQMRSVQPEGVQGSGSWSGKGFPSHSLQDVKQGVPASGLICCGVSLKA